MRNTVVEGVPSLTRISTTEEKALNLEGVYTATKDVKSAIFWGDCPGLSYILRIPSAISTTWPDLDSYTLKRLETDISQLTNPPSVIIGKNASTDGIHKSAKWDILEKLIEDNDMTVSYENEEYLVYTSCSE